MDTRKRGHSVPTSPVVMPAAAPLASTSTPSPAAARIMQRARPRAGGNQFFLDAVSSVGGGSPSRPSPSSSSVSSSATAPTASGATAMVAAGSRPLRRFREFRPQYDEEEEFGPGGVSVTFQKQQQQQNQLQVHQQHQVHQQDTDYQDDQDDNTDTSVLEIIQYLQRHPPPDFELEWLAQRDVTKLNDFAARQRTDMAQITENLQRLTEMRNVNLIIDTAVTHIGEANYTTLDIIVDGTRTPTPISMSSILLFQWILQSNVFGVNTPSLPPQPQQQQQQQQLLNASTSADPLPITPATTTATATASTTHINIFEKISLALQSIVEQSTLNESLLIYWLNSCLTLVDFVNSEIHQHADLLAQQKGDTIPDVDAFLASLYQVAQSIYTTLVNNLLTKVQPILLDAFLGKRITSQEEARSSDNRTIGNILNQIVRYIEMLRSQQLLDEQISHFVAQTLHVINATIMNHLLSNTTGNVCMSTGLQLKMSLSEVDHWIEHSQNKFLSKSRSNLAFIREAANVLTAIKPQLENPAIRERICPTLTPTHIKTLLHNYRSDFYDPNPTMPSSAFFHSLEKGNFNSSSSSSSDKFVDTSFAFEIGPTTHTVELVRVARENLEGLIVEWSRRRENAWELSSLRELFPFLPEKAAPSLTGISVPSLANRQTRVRRESWRRMVL